MFTTPIYLLTRCPSPTTVSYTASNAPPNKTLVSKAIFYLTVVFRVFIGLFALLVVVTKAQCTPIFLSIVKGLEGETIMYNCSRWISALRSEAVDGLARRHSWQVIGAGSLMVFFLVFRRFYTEESLLVLRTLGIQTSTTSSTYLNTSTTRFIPTSLIQDIIIHEAFRGFEVRYYLAVIVEGEGEVVVVFPNLLPKREIVEEVWRGARACLFDSKG